jgi:hypothetical protein
MTKMKRFLALTPVVALAAACSGVAPTGPSPITSSEPNEVVSGYATATALPCPGLTSISLAVVPSLDAYVWVEATYHYSAPASQLCAAPRWTSDRNQMVVNRNNPMRAGFRRSAGGKATLTATAANRISNSILVTIGPSTQIGSSIIPSPLPQACRDIAGVTVRIVPNPATNRDVLFETSYRYKSPISGICSVAPRWTATRRGLTVNAADPFRSSIGRRTDVRTTVTSTAPNGVSGSVTF